MDWKKILPVNPKGNQSWLFDDAESEAPILLLPVVKNWLTGRDPVAGENWRQEEKWTIDDEMVECQHCLNEYEFEQALGVGHGQGSLACYSPWGCKESNMTEQLKWTELNHRVDVLHVE